MRWQGLFCYLQLQFFKRKDSEWTQASDLGTQKEKSMVDKFASANKPQKGERIGNSRFMTHKQIAEELGVSTVTVWRLGRDDQTFPRSRKLSAGRVGVLRTEFEEWVASRPIVN